MSRQSVSSVASVLGCAVVVGIPALAGCGQKGPLTLPVPPAAAPAAPVPGASTNAAPAASAPAR